MKKNCLLILVTTIFFFSCSNSQNSKLIYTDENTIKDIIKEKETSALWTEELEKGRLTEKNRLSEQYINKNIELDLEVAKIVKYQDKVFPEYDDFGSLNTSTLESSVTKRINEFCEALSSDLEQVSSEFFVDKYYFTYEFFKYDFKLGWKKNFNENIGEKKKSDSDLNLIKKWYIGEPFYSENIIQLPVRLVVEKGTVDINLFLDYENNHKIYQINILKWGD